jgi:Contractile injection system tube protein
LERVAFLLEHSGEHLGCLLNPESLVLRRQAGIQPRRSSGGLVTGVELADDRLLYSGGGRTELELDLLFDVSLSGSSIATEDVRDLTRPLWELAENTSAGGYGRPPLCRFVWGKSWNIPGVVAAVAERLEMFTAEGVPRRSWLRMRLLRTLEPVASQRPPGAALAEEELPGSGMLRAAGQAEVHEILGGEAAEGGERPDSIAYRYYGDAALWRELLAVNSLEDPLHIPAGHLLRLPPLSELLGAP